MKLRDIIAKKVIVAQHKIKIMKCTKRSKCYWDKKIPLRHYYYDIDMMIYGL